MPALDRCPITWPYFPDDPPIPAAFADQVVWSCVWVHTDRADGTIITNGEAAGVTDWPSVTVPVGSLSYPDAVWTPHPSEGSPYARINPWTFSVVALFGPTGPPIQDISYHATVGLPSGSHPYADGAWHAIGGGDGFPVPSPPAPTPPPTLYQRAELLPFGAVGVYPDSVDPAVWLPIPGGTSAVVRANQIVPVVTDPPMDFAIDGYFHYFLPALGAPPAPRCAPNADPFGGLSDNPLDNVFWAPASAAWRGGSTGTIESLMTTTVPAASGYGMPWSLVANAYRDPMGRVYARKNGGPWIEGTFQEPPPVPFPHSHDWFRWETLTWTPGDTAEIGVSNAASGAWSDADYTDPAMGRVSVQPRWVVCAFDELAWVSSQLG